VAAAFAYQHSRHGRKLRASREDPAAARATGIDIHRERLWAFALSGALSGFAGGLLVHLAGTLQARDVYLDLTFLTLAMLVVGGVGSLWGAACGSAAVSALDTFPAHSRERRDRFVTDLVGKPLWGGSRLGRRGDLHGRRAVLPPEGLTRGREFRLPTPRRRVPARENAA
jgi:branched-chain amino acid transport system permease protein